MGRARLALWVSAWGVLLAVCSFAQEEIPRVDPGGALSFLPCSSHDPSEAPLCPHRRKSATLVPSFTKTTMSSHPTSTPHHVTNHTTPHATTSSHHTTVQPQKHTTTHHHHHHSITTHHPQTTITTHHPYTTTSTSHKTTHHRKTTTTAHHPHTTTSHNTTHQPQTTTTNHHPHTTTSISHTTTHLPHNQTTPRPHNHTTPHPPAPTNHTTAHTFLTTSHPPTHLPIPTQLPFVSVGDYVVGDKPACLRARMGLQLQVYYTDKAKRQLWGEFAVQPNHTNASGICSDRTAILNLHFPEGFVLFTFQKNETQNKFYLSRIQANLTYRFPQATETFFQADNASLHEFEAHLGHSYQCRNKSLTLAEGFHLSALQERVQAFELKGREFGDADICPEQRRSNILPIVVGVALGLLILIVVVAFLVGRKRQHSGYQNL